MVVEKNLRNPYFDEDQYDQFSYVSILRETRSAVAVEPLDVLLERSLKTNLCKHCKISLRNGVKLIAIWEFLIWTISMSFAIYGFLKWTSKEAKRDNFELDVRNVYHVNNPEEYNKFRIGLICLIAIFGIRGFAAVILFLGACLKSPSLCLDWMIVSFLLSLALLGICVGVPVNILYFSFIPVFLIWVVEVWHVLIHRKILIRLEKEDARLRKYMLSPRQKKYFEDAMRADQICEDDRTVVDLSIADSDKSYPFKYKRKEKKPKQSNKKKKLVIRVQT